jgi:WD40 repeat protein
VWDAATGKEVANLAGHPKHITSLQWSPDGRTLVTGCADDKVRVWTVPSFQMRATFATRGSAMGMAFTPDGRTLATSLWMADTKPGASVRLWDTATWKERTSLFGHTKFVWTPSFAPGERTLATASMDGTVKLWALPGQVVGK